MGNRRGNVMAGLCARVMIVSGCGVGAPADGAGDKAFVALLATSADQQEKIRGATPAVETAEQSEVASVTQAPIAPPTLQNASTGGDPAKEDAPRGLVEVTGFGVRLRESPSLEAPVVAELNRGVKLPLVRWPEGADEWVCVRREGDADAAWIHKDFVKIIH